MDLGSLVDGIYEAAFVPDRWSEILGQISRGSHAASGELIALEEGCLPRCRATPPSQDIIDGLIADGTWRDCERAATLISSGHRGFLCDADFLTPEQFARDPLRKVFEPVGLGWYTGTVLPMPTGEFVSISFQRQLENGMPDTSQITFLNSLRPHLARAGLIAARLRLERAENTVAALKAIGLAAAVLNTAGRILAVSAELEKFSSTFLPLAFGRFGVMDASAQCLFERALARLRDKEATAVQSIPISAHAGGKPLILHVLPLVREARNAFSEGEILVVATPLKTSALVPSPKLLNALFDLSPSEAKLASALAGGLSIKEAATDMGVTFSTARTYIESVFRKTGTHQQSQLVALLKSVPAIGEPG